MAHPRFAVVICAYADDRLDHLLAAVESVRRQTAAPAEILAVIDHNPRMQAEAIARLPGVVVLANQRARGLSGARNSGVAVASAPLVAFLDDDAVAAPDWLAELGVGFADPAVVGVGGAIEPQWIGGRPAWFPD